MVRRPVSPVLALESLLTLNSPQPATWALMISQSVKTVLQDSQAGAVKDVPKDTLAIRCRERDVLLAMKLMATAITVTKTVEKAAIVEFVSAR